jgi:hypothetical protein
LDLKGRKKDREENGIIMNFIGCILHRILIVGLHKGGRGGWDMWNAWERGEVLTGFWLAGPKARGHWEDLDVSGRITLRWTLGR